MDIVDSQVHFNLLGDLEAGIAAMDAVGVKSLVYDEFWGFDAKSRILPGSRAMNDAANGAILPTDRFQGSLHVAGVGNIAAVIGRANAALTAFLERTGGTAD